ncbi:hypothetical protein Syun_029388 [Stephania yunnanensis]|uniref:Uncharacterized protein n=1 Tax=Stephania yunnanensis TaxID=152371 RepID=A0AAP0EDI7_9MAGN
MGFRPKPESAGLLPRLNVLLVGTPYFLFCLYFGALIYQSTCLWIVYSLLYSCVTYSFLSNCMNSTVLVVLKCCICPTGFTYLGSPFSCLTECRAADE